MQKLTDALGYARQHKIFILQENGRFSQRWLLYSKLTGKCLGVYDPKRGNLKVNGEKITCSHFRDAIDILSKL